MKVLVIENCSKCPHMLRDGAGFFCEERGEYNEKSAYEGVSKWCPLEDYEEEE